MTGPRGVWVAYYTDGSETRIFRSEIAALRTAVDTTMSVVFVEWGQSLAEAAAAGGSVGSSEEKP